MNILESIKNRISNFDTTTALTSIISSFTAMSTEDYVQLAFTLLSIGSALVGFYNSNKKLLIEVELQDEEKRKKQLENDLLESETQLRILSNKLAYEKLMNSRLEGGNDEQSA